MHIKSGIVTVGALAMVMAGPAALGAWLSRTPAPVVSVPPAAVLAIAGQVPPGADSAPIALTPALGTLFGGAGVTVNRPGGPLSLGGGLYAYPGGEGISIGDGGLGVLRIPGAGTVFLCGGASGAMSRGADGRLSLTLDAGTARLIFEPGSAPDIDAGGQALAPGEGAPDEPFAVEVTVLGDQLLVLPIGASLNSPDGALKSPGGQPWQGGAEDRALWAMDNGENSSDSEARALELPPGTDLAGDLASQPADSSTGGEYLCQSPDLADALSQTPQGGPQTLPPSRSVPLPDDGRTLDAPQLPGLAFAEPGAVESFDPNALPAPAAGPGGSDGDGPGALSDATPVQVVVPVPALPVVSTGGAGLASPD